MLRRKSYLDQREVFLSVETANGKPCYKMKTYDSRDMMILGTYYICDLLYLKMIIWFKSWNSGKNVALIVAVKSV